MGNKSNIRSIRFSDDLAELIDHQVGDTFTAKFENLITRCVWELPEKEKQLAAIQERIDRERQRLDRLQKVTYELRMLEEYLQNTQRAFKVLERKAKDMAEAARNTTSWRRPAAVVLQVIA